MAAKMLRTNRRKEDAKMVGVYMPLWINSYIGLYTTAKGYTKASILRSLIENWVTQQRTKSPDDALIDEIRKRTLKQWALSKEVMSLNAYKAFIKEELEGKDIQPSIVQLILNDLK